MAATAYQKLKDELFIIKNIRKANYLLNWDREVMMPKHANDERAKILATLSATAHERAIAPQLGEWIAAAHDEVTDAWDKRNMLLIKENYELATKVPTPLVYALEEVRSKTTRAWQEAKPTNDWKAVFPLLKELIARVREVGSIYSEILHRPLYDALMFSRARGNTQAVIDPLFGELKKELPPLMHAVMKTQKPGARVFTLSEAAQEKLARDLAQKIGFSFERGRLDRSAHPFSGGTNNDSRITTRYSENMPFTSLYGVMHEVGHALYSQNLPRAWDGLPVGGDSDLSLHESQSLIVEKQAGYSNAFIAYLYDLIVKEEPSFGQQGTQEDFRNTVHEVRPSYIRVDADEVTYPLHVILRYEIEKELFVNDTDPSDIPDMWNARFEELLGLKVPEHKQGCMQDIHWFMGSFGYFPTYTQGALYAAQLMAAMKRAIPDVNEQLGRGEFKAFIGWLNKNVHQWGQFLDAPDLITQATGEKPTARYFLEHLKARYLNA